MQNEFSFQEQNKVEAMLNPPISRWLEDMPENNNSQLVPPELTWVNCICDIWMEFPRYGNTSWIGSFFAMILCVGVLLFFCSFTFLLYQYTHSISIAIVFVVGGGVFFSFFILFLKICFVEPRDQPIRLNRKRQKVYIYCYKRIALLPWIKWPSSVQSYNWSDVHGELGLFSTYGGGAVMLYGSVCQPGTYNVTDRFLIAAGAYTEVQQIWSYLCQYMQHEDNLPEPHFPGRPDFWCPRKADKWPEDMEKESTTAPDEDECQQKIKNNLNTPSK